MEFNHLQHTRSAFGMVDEGGLILDINRSAEKLLQVKRAEVTGKLLSDLMEEPEKLQRFLQLWKRSQINLPALLKICSQGKVIEIKAYGHLSVTGTKEKPGIIVIEFESKEKSNKNFSILNNKIDELNKEVILRKKAESNLSKLIQATSTSTGKRFFRNFSSQLGSALGTSQILICEHLKEKTIILANSIYGKLDEVDSRILDATNIKQTLNNEHRTCVDLSHNKVVRNVQLFGQSNNDYALCFPILDSDQKILGNICIADNKPIENVNKIIEFVKPFAERVGVEIIRKRAEDDLKLAKQELEKRVEERTRELDIALQKSKAATKSKSEFLANMSHEVRTPMNGVLGMLNIISETHLDKEQHELVKTAYNSAENLLTILNDILDLSKIEAGKMEFESVEFDIRQIIEDTATLFATNAHSKGLEITCEVNDQVPVYVKGDPTRTRQILANLTGNAIKFTKQGEVSLSVNLLNSANGKLNLSFEVRDTGIGISQEGIEKIFESFSQADGSTTRMFGGTGLGLSICKQLVELMRGELQVKSEVGKGSQFIFNINFEAANNFTQHEHDNLHFDIDKLRVLLVDDNDTNLRILSNHLKNWGIKYTAVKDGHSAFEVMKISKESANPYNLIITDMMMPGMDGLQLIEAIRNELDLKALKILLLTSVTTDIRKKANQFNVTAVLNKPIRQSLLYDTIINETQHLATSKNGNSQENVTHDNFTTEQSRILVVEDNLINQKVARGMLKKYGFEIELANNGQEAIEILETKTFDLIFMDCQMPVMDGYQATRSIKSSGLIDKAVPIVAMTANAMTGDREKCIAAGMDDYISKPLKPSELFDCLNRWLNHEKNQVAQKNAS